MDIILGISDHKGDILLLGVVVIVTKIIPDSNSSIHEPLGDSAIYCHGARECFNPLICKQGIQDQNC